MTQPDPQVVIQQLTASDRRKVMERERKHRSRLARQGYATQTLFDDTGCFGIVMVEDPETQRTGVLLPDGNVRWMDEASGFGALADAAVRNASIDGTPL